MTQRKPAGDGRSVVLMDVTLDALTEAEVIDHIVGSIKSGVGGWLVNPNVDVLRIITGTQELRDLVGRAQLVVADGMPLIWASRIQGTPLPERVAGASLIHDLSARAGGEGIEVFLLGGGPGVAERAAKALEDQTPGLKAAWHFPPFGFEDNPGQRAAMYRALDDAGPAIVYCGLGFPKQERLMADLHERYPEYWFIGSGAAIGFAAGHLDRAPDWMQRSGLEWLHRLVKEPRRLFHRYVVEDVPFALRLLVAGAKSRALSSRSQPPA